MAAILIAPALAIAPAVAIGPVSPAHAHNYVVASTPAKNSTVTSQPGTVSLTTNDALLESGLTALQVVDAAGRHYETACPVIDDATLAAPAELGEAGAYTVRWQVVSADGHPISGEFGFDWQPADGEMVSAGTESPTCETADASAAVAPSEPTTSAPGAEASVVPTDLLWVGGGLLAVLAAAAVTWFVVRRRAESEVSPPDETD